MCKMHSMYIDALYVLAKCTLGANASEKIHPGVCIATYLWFAFGEPPSIVVVIGLTGEWQLVRELTNGLPGFDTGVVVDKARVRPQPPITTTEARNPQRDMAGRLRLRRQLTAAAWPG